MKLNRRPWSLAVLLDFAHLRAPRDSSAPPPCALGCTEIGNSLFRSRSIAQLCCERAASPSKTTVPDAFSFLQFLGRDCHNELLPTKKLASGRYSLGRPHDDVGVRENSATTVPHTLS